MEFTQSRLQRILLGFFGMAVLPCFFLLVIGLGFPGGILPATVIILLECFIIYNLAKVTRIVAHADNMEYSERNRLLKTWNYEIRISYKDIRKIKTIHGRRDGPIVKLHYVSYGEEKTLQINRWTASDSLGLAEFISKRSGIAIEKRWFM